MRHQAAVGILALLAAAVAGAGSRVQVKVENVTPDGYESSVLRPGRGRVLVVNFWATWCQPCVEEMPAILAGGKKFSGRGVALVLVSADFLKNRDTGVKGFLEKLSSPFPAFIEDAADPQTFIDRVDPKWGGELPHTVFYGRDGAKRYSTSETLTAARLGEILERGLRDW